MSLAKRIRGAAAKTFGKSVRVVGIESMSPRVLRLRVRGSPLRGLAVDAGSKIKLHIGDGEMRSYTPAGLDPQAGEMDIVFHVHGDSPASNWVTGLQVDDEVSFVGPTASIAGPTGPLAWAGFYGDETTIGLAEAIANALPSGTPWSGAIEAAPDDCAAVGHLGLDAVARTQTHGAALVAHLAGASLPTGAGLMWLSGEAGSVLALRQALLDGGLPREQLRIKPYWSLKGKAHRKELERTVLRS